MHELPKALSIDHVVDRIYISGWRATLYEDFLRQGEIIHVLKLYQGIPSFPDDFDVCEVGIEDGEPVPAEAFQHGVRFVVDHINVGRAVLVMCGAGISRSATFVLASLIERKYDLREAFRLLRQKHPEATPHPALWISLIQHYALSYTLDDALEWMREDRGG
ncbi:MAG: dual specificity protein phosphatase family protein [Chloroflexi bacterium]|nr:dual specificity protein phosphatase family protein [Chloroflexota bacterium]